MIQNYVKLALRNLYKHRVSTLINLLGLTLGITACLAIYVVTHFELSYDTFHPDGARIYRLVGQSKFNKTDTFKPLGFVPRAVPQAVRTEITGLETVAAFHNIESDVAIPGGNGELKHFERRNMDTDHAQIVLAGPSYFEIFRYEWLAGDSRSALKEPNSVVLTEEKARLYFGDLPLSEVLGREVVYRGDIRATVTGIVQDWTQNTDFTFTDFLSESTIGAGALQKEINLNEWSDVWSASQCFVKLAPGVAPAQVNAQLAGFAKKHFGPAAGTGDFLFVPSLQPLSDLHFNEDYGDNYSRKAHLPTLYGLMGVAIFILLIAAVNFINLATAQSAQRAREIGMRKVLGGSRGSLMLQFLSETLVLTTLAAGVSLLLAPAALTEFKAFIPEGGVFAARACCCFWRRWSLSAPCCRGCILPDHFLVPPGPDPERPERAERRPERPPAQRPDRVPVRFFAGVHHRYHRHRAAVALYPRQASVFRATPWCWSVRRTTTKARCWPKSPLTVGRRPRSDGVVSAAGRRSHAHPHDVWKTAMHPDFEMTYRQRLATRILFPVRFTPAGGAQLVCPATACVEIVVNERFLSKRWAFRRPADAVGQMMAFNGKEYPVSGVAADFHEHLLHTAIQPVFIAHMPKLAKDLAIKLCTRGKGFRDAQATLASIGQVWNTVYPGKKFEYTFLDESIAKLYERDSQTAQLVSAATAIAILISCMGLFGLVTFMAEQRAKEIGVRKVLGASVASVVGLLSRDFLMLVLIALAIASPVAYWLMNKWLSDFAYRIDIQWWMFAAAGGAAVSIAFLTVGFQSVKAALANPVISLRAE